MKYRVTIAEAKTYKQFVGEVDAGGEQEAQEKAMQIFKQENPQYMYHCKVIMCSRVIKY